MIRAAIPLTTTFWPWDRAVLQIPETTIATDETVEASKESFFAVGLFSLMDAVMSAPMNDLLETLPFSSEVKAALTERAGVRGEAVRCAPQLERRASEGTAIHNLAGARIAEIYLDSITWADKVTAGVKWLQDWRRQTPTLLRLGVLLFGVGRGEEGAYVVVAVGQFGVLGDPLPLQE